MSVDAQPQVAAPNVPRAETDGLPPKSPWHVLQIGLLLELGRTGSGIRPIYSAGGNLFSHVSEKWCRSKDGRGPDCFDADGRYQACRICPGSGTGR